MLAVHHHCAAEDRRVSAKLARVEGQPAEGNLSRALVERRLLQSRRFGTNARMRRLMNRLTTRRQSATSVCADHRLVRRDRLDLDWRRFGNNLLERGASPGFVIGGSARL